jgi:hypothetical protein
MEGDFVLPRIYNVKNKNKKLAKRQDNLFKVLRILGQGTAEKNYSQKKEQRL